MSKRQYDPAAVEKKWQERWKTDRLYEVDPAKASKPFYCLDMFPYPSGEGLHVGHWRGYVLSDFYARYYRLKGYDVLHPMGYDAFGLPAERAAIKHKSHPKKFTDQAIPTFSRQLGQIGAAYDWTKTISTADPNYYHWTQWLFLQFFKHGLAEKRKSLVNWCPNDQTVLANEQVINGCCERCGAKVTKKELEQWYLKTTAFAEDLVNGLADVNWSEHVKTLQRNWIGKSEGAEIDFAIAGQKASIAVFTTRPDTIFGVTALVLAPEHPLAQSLVSKDKEKEFETYQKQVAAKTNVDRAQGKESAKTAFFTGNYVLHPIMGEKLPVWLADYVLMEYGTGAVMSVPAHDERDFMFAKTHNLPIKEVIAERFVQTTEPGIYRPDEPTKTMDGVIVFVKHWQDDKYIGLKWKEVAWGTLLTGSVDEGMTPEETVLKEIREETGYLHPKITAKLGVADGLFYHVPKKTNKLVHGHIFVAELTDDAREAIDDEEDSKHDIQWLTTDELTSFLTPETHTYALKLLRNGFQPHPGRGSLINSTEFTGLDPEEAAEKIVAALEKQRVGQKSTTYRLRDWLVSRQRYWGAPIPIVYDPDGKAHPVKDEHLPLELPTDVDFLPGGESPLARSRDYKLLAEKLYGEGWHFETDTLDTFVDSSWYYLRYLSPTDPKEAFRPELVKKWLPIDLYIGGIEHATLHLLYARFVTKFLAKFGYIDSAITEPIDRLYNIGMINLHGAKMSKSKGNVISPDDLVEHYGTDALRGYELFIGPMDIEAEWNPRGINGIHRFLIKIFYLKDKVTSEAEDDQYFPTYLSKIEPMIKDFRLNTVISEAMKLVNQWEKLEKISQRAFQNFLITIAPIFPFIAEELWVEVSGNDSQTIFRESWPIAKEIKTVASISILINQKYVAKFTPTSEADVEGSTKEAAAIPAVAARLKGAKSYQSIYRPGQLINFVVTGK